MEKLLEILASQNVKVSEELTSQLKEAAQAEAAKRLENFIALYPDVKADDLKAYKKVFVENFGEDIKVEYEPVIEEDVQTEITSLIDNNILEAKKEAIPEQLKIFVTEEGSVDEDKLAKVNTAIVKAEKEEAFEAFKETPFIKGIKDADVTMEKFEEVKSTISEDIFNKIMSGEIEAMPLIASAFVKVEEVEAAAETKKTPFQAVTATMPTEQAAEINEALEQAVAEVVNEKKNLAKEKNITDESIIFGGVTEEVYANKIRETLENDFAKTTGN